MAIEKVRAYLEAFGVAGRILEFDAGTATVVAAAAALGCAAQRIAKTLSFKLAGGGVLIVAAGDVKVDNAKYKARFGAKATMLSPDEAIAMTGHAVGGVCPFAISESVPVYLDVSLKRFETVFPACGSANSVIEMTIPELERYSNTAGWVDVCKAWQ
jgi:prolyl-tRNA editing enzyme YbaK/EbsC (Cys-tRNA(Pro) deacylase)